VVLSQKIRGIRPSEFMKMDKKDFAEEVFLQALTGRLVGEDLLASYNKIAVISMKNIICCSNATAAESAFISQTGGRAWHFIVERGIEKEVIKKVKDYDGEAILLLFGGETPIDEAKELFANTLKEMASMEIIADIVIHTSIFSAGGLDEAIKDEKVKEYLKERNVYVYTFNMDEGMMLVHEIEFNNGVNLNCIAELPITCEHTRLLNKIFRNKKLVWVM